MQKLLDIMARLRDPETGCPWDVEQDFASIAPYTIEEAYEVADAIDRGDLADLRDELGDLLLQVVFHAQIAQEQGAFEFADVAEGIATKLVRRHPHVFAGTGVDDATARSGAWEAHKADERAAARKDAGALWGIARNLPALTRAAKLGKRAARVGFDWPDIGGVRDKIDEELGELRAAETDRDPDAMAEELGDVLFAVANLGRHLGVNPEECLRQANLKFERRFTAMETTSRADGVELESLCLADLEARWQQVKSAEPG